MKPEETNYEQVNRARSRNRWRSRVQTGLCGVCGKPRANKSRCSTHAQEHREARRMKYKATRQ